MSSNNKVDQGFINFVMQKKVKVRENERNEDKSSSNNHIKKSSNTNKNKSEVRENILDTPNDYKIKFLGNLDLGRKKIKEEEIVRLNVSLNENNQNDGSLKSLLSQMNGQVIKKADVKIEDEENNDNEEDGEEESENESDYEEGKVNHYIRDAEDDLSGEEDFAAEGDEDTSDRKKNTNSNKPFHIECEIFVENIPQNKHEKQIIKFLRNVSDKVKRVKVLRNKTKAFLKLSSKADAQKILNRGIRYDNVRLNLSLIDKESEQKSESTDNKQGGIGVKNKKERKFETNSNSNTTNNNKSTNYKSTNYSSQSAPEQNSSHTAFIRNLPLSITEEALSKHFKKVTNVRLMKSKEGKVKGFGYLDFKSEEAMNKAIDNSEPVIIEGKQVVLEKAKSSFNSQVFEDTKRLGKKKKRSMNNTY